MGKGHPRAPASTSPSSLRPIPRAAFSSAALQDPPTTLLAKASPLTCVLDPIPSCLLQDVTPATVPFCHWIIPIRKQVHFNIFHRKRQKLLPLLSPPAPTPYLCFPFTEVLKKIVSSHCHHVLSSELSFHPLQIFTPTTPLKLLLLRLPMTPILILMGNKDGSTPV